MKIFAFRLRGEGISSIISSLERGILVAIMELIINKFINFGMGMHEYIVKVIIMELAKIGTRIAAETFL